MVAGVAVDDIEVMDFVEMVFGGIGGKDAGDAGIKAAPENGGDACFPEALLVSPLPFVFEFGFITGFIVGRIEVTGFGFQASVHDGEILVGQGHIDDQVGFKSPDQGHQLGHIIGIHLGGFDAVASDLARDGIALGLGAAGQHDVAEYPGKPRHLMHHNGSHTAGADH